MNKAKITSIGTVEEDAYGNICLTGWAIDVTDFDGDLIEPNNYYFIPIQNRKFAGYTFEELKEIARDNRVFSVHWFFRFAVWLTPAIILTATALMVDVTMGKNVLYWILVFTFSFVYVHLFPSVLKPFKNL